MSRSSTTCSIRQCPQIVKDGNDRLKVQREQSRATGEGRT